MDLGLQGKTAVVTGGASGIGLATARLLLAEGARVASWDIVETPVAEPQDKSVLNVRADITSLAEVENAWRKSESKLGPVDVLVHAAAIGSGHFGFPWTNVPIAAWKNVMNVNVTGMVHVAQVAGPAMKARSRGSMIFLASIAGQIGSQTDPPYSASKAAGINFAQCLARDLAADGVRVNSVCPGMVQTPLNRAVWRAWHDQQPADKQKSYEDWAGEKIARVIPLKRWQKPEDIASMIVFLSSSRASEVTGQTINVDGGCVMHS